MEKFSKFKLSITIFILNLNLSFASIFDLPLPFFNSYNTIDSIDGNNYQNHWQFLRDNFTWSNDNQFNFDHTEVQKQLKYIKSHPNYMSAITKRAEPYLFYLSQEIYNRNLPAEIALIPVIESEFNASAYSSAGAAGLWQIMPKTAENFGISQNWWFDGRLDVVTSTKAALDYLEKLYFEFDEDWLLALAAYNSGNGTIRKAIRYNKTHNKDTDFWSLNLPKETMRYIPKLLAFIEIIKKPKKYNQTLLELPHEPYFDVVKLEKQIDLSLAAKLSNLELKNLQALNPGFNRLATTPDGPHHLILPIYNTSVFNQNIKQLSTTELVTYKKYSVKHGDTLLNIAKKFDTNVSVLKRLNQLSSNSIKSDKDLIIPVKGQA